MYEELLKGLANQGPMGLMLGILVLMFVRFFNRTFDAQVERDRSNAQFMQHCLAALQEIKTSCLTCRTDIVASEISRLGAAEDRIVAAIRETSEHVIAETRRDNDLSRPHLVEGTPPPLSRQPFQPATGYRRGP